MATEANQRSNIEEIDFTANIVIFWRSWELIFFGSLTVILRAAALSLFIHKTYRSEGFYQLGHPNKEYHF